jgi:tetratricopeptide (TPR) repeat protein
MTKTILIIIALCSFTFSVFGQTSTPAGDGFDKYIFDAYALYSQQKYEEALTACKKAVELRPADNRPYALSGAVYLAQWKLEEASALFALAIRFSPLNPVLHYMKARADRFRNAREEGLVSLRKAIELRPNYAEAYLLLGDLLVKDDERTAAFRKAIELDPKLVDAYYYLGMQLETVKKDEKAAEEVYRTAIEIDPKKMAGRFNLGRLLVKQGRLAEGRKVWNERTSDEDRTFPNFITVLVRAERLEAAKQAHAKNTNDPEANLKMGLAVMDGDHWVVDGRWESAIVYFKKALAIKPDLAKAQHAICKAYVEIANVFKSKNEILDQELAKLRKLDSKLADDIVEYRRTYSGGLKAAGPPPPPVKNH